MAILNKQEHEALLKRIAETSGDTAATLELIAELQSDFDEREQTINAEDGKPWKDKYTELNAQYVERFFTTPTEVKAAQTENVKLDGESGNTSFDDLFKEREG